MYNVAYLHFFIGLHLLAIPHVQSNLVGYRPLFETEHFR